VVIRLVASRDALVAAEQAKSATLASIEDGQADVHAEIEALEDRSAELAAQIRQSQQESSSSTAPIPPPSGNGILGWPVSGTVVSGFGMRWGRMHEGIDITASMNTPVHASAAGRVINAGWLGGYGNLVVVDHGGGLSTAYAHNTSFAVSVGDTVSAGQVIAYSGSTGDSSGPHVHFEVRVNGSAVDPLGYL
jgi:murein DD-endopeptidase MepM/ murein hydrolase activator NlpD